MCSGNLENHFVMRRFVWLCVLAVGLLPLLEAIVFAQARTGPFTQAPRSLRSRVVDQKHIRLEFRFDFEQQRIAARAIHSLDLLKDASSIELDAASMKIERVELRNEKDGSPTTLKHASRGQTLTIDLDHAYKADESLQLAIDYSVEKPRRGFHFVAPDADEKSSLQMVWTQSEPEYARYWVPCIDAPGDRITSEIIATVPKKFVVLSNGSLESKKDNDDGTTTWHWSQVRSHVPYLLSVVAGDFEIFEQSWDGIPVLSYVPRGRLADAPRSFEKTPAMLRFFSEKIGYRYPWPKYAQICVDEYGWGGMEHTSATTLNLNTLHDERAHHDISSVNLVAHELAHQWWGDLLTCKDWGELWLNESFATYFATLWTEHDEGADEAAWQRYQEAESYLKEDARYRRSIVSYRYNSPENMFDGHSYPKGGRVLHMLRYELGEEAFWKAMRRYCEINQFRTVETADLRIAIEESTGQGMNWFFDQWLYHGGHPEFHVEWSYDAAAKSVRLSVKQAQKIDDVTPLFRTSADVAIVLPGETLTRRVTLSKADETFHFDVAERPSRVCFDPQDWVLKKLIFPKSKEELLDQLANDAHVMARVQAVHGLADRKTDQDVIAALIAAVKGDKFWGVRQEAAKLLAKCSGDAARQSLIAAAKDDAKSFVRREALAGLANFPHDESRLALRDAIDRDASYYAVAEGLKALAKIDKANARDVLLKAVEMPSHGEVIVRAAGDALVDLKDKAAAEKIAELLKGDITRERRVALVAALARLKEGDSEVRELLFAQLDSKRIDVRRAAIEAIVALGDSSAIERLQAQRDKEEVPRTIRSIEEGIVKLREKQPAAEQMRKELDMLRKRNEQLEERLKKLEAVRK